jgi:DNA relaxase NicK
MRNVLKILIGKRKRKRPLRGPRNRWEVQCKIKVDALLNTGSYYSALKMEAERSSEKFVPAQQSTWHTSNVNVRHLAVLRYCLAKIKVSQTRHLVISKVIRITLHEGTTCFNA